MNDQVIAIVVTYNRLELLKETISAIRNQTVTVIQIVVIDNDSTDNTPNWLATQDGLKVIHQKNTGGSGGFYTGIKYAVTQPCGWVWVMDDDTICQPDTLEKLIAKTKGITESIGFVSSKSVWTDGNPHLMNIPAITPSFNQLMAFNRFDAKGVLLVENSSFVSLMISRQAIEKVGLPYKEFFIWGDDQEYTRRITKANFLGLYCMDSIVQHQTPTNYFPDFYHDTINNLWKHRYGFRNEFFMVKKNKGFLYFIFWLMLKLLYTSVKLIKIRKDHTPVFIGALLKAGWQAIFFDPKIDMIKTNNP